MSITMAYSVVSKKSGKTYYLHKSFMPRKDGGQTSLYYFAGTAKESAIDSVSDGFQVIENERTGLPFLKRK